MSAGERLISGGGVMASALLRAAAVAAISLVMALPAVAQEHLTTPRPYNPLVIPDNPCMTPAQLKKLQLLRDEWALEYDHEAAAFEQLDALEKLDNAIAVAEKGFFETADTQHKYEAAKAQYKSMGGRAAQGRFLKRFYEAVDRRVAIAKEFDEVKASIKCPEGTWYPLGPNLEPVSFLGAQPFVGVNVSGGFQNTNFSVSDTGFNVNGSGVMGGGFAGVLLPIPNTIAGAGFRVGGQGGNITGDIRMPTLSPTFNYTVKTDATLYQEAVVSIPASKITSFLLNVAYDVPLAPKWDFAFGASVGVAESHTSVNGTAGAFSVTDSGWRPGITFTAGVAKPVAILANGAVVDLFAQYRGTQFISRVNVPGAVNIGSFTNEVDGGITVHFGGGVSWTLR
jgi:hypothetical protein